MDPRIIQSAKNKISQVAQRISQGNGLAQQAYRAVAPQFQATGQLLKQGMQDASRQQVNSPQRLATQFGSNFANTSTFGATNKFGFSPQSPMERTAAVAGGVAGFVNPLNPINKVMGGLNTAGVASARFLPKAAPKLLSKVAPHIASEGLQTGALTGYQAATGQKITPVENLAFGLGVRGIGGVVGKTANAKGFTTQYNTKMAPRDLDETARVIERYHFNKGDLNYMVNQGSKDEKFIRQMAGDYISKKLAKDKDLKKVTQELVNRLRVDQQASPISLGLISNSQRKQMQGVIGKAAGDSPQTLNKVVDTVIASPKDGDYINKLKAARAQLNKQQYEMFGATTGNYKKDYATLQNLKQDAQVGPMLDNIEQQIKRLDEIISAPQATGGVNSQTGRLRVKPQGLQPSTQNPRNLDEFLPGETGGLQKPPKQNLQSPLQQAQTKLAQTGRADQLKPLEDILSSGGTDVKQKVNILDYLRTPDRVLNKIGLGKEAALIRKKYDDYLDELPKNIDKITEWSKQVPPESSKRIFKYLDGEDIVLADQEMKVAKEIKTWLSNWADRLHLPKDKRVSSYITHIFEKDFIEKEFDDDLAKIIQDKVPGSVYDPFLEKRMGALGYVEDAWRALDAYAKRATRKVHMDPALEQTKKAAEHLEMSQYKYVKSYVDRVNMRPTEMDNLLDNTIKQVIGYRLGGRPTAAISRTLRQMVYRGTLGLNPGSALRNLTQGANTYSKLGEKYTTIGYFKAFTRLGDDELERVGVLRDSFIQDRALSATKKAVETFDKGLFFFFSAAERINRGAAYFGAKSKGLNDGMSEEEAINYAKNIVRDTQFTFGSVDTPVALQSDIAKTIAQLQSFTIKQGEFLGEMLGKKDLAGITRYTLASLVMVHTLGKLIGMKPEQIIPMFRFDLPPTMQAPVEIGKALLQDKDEYGNDLTAQDKLESVGKSFIPYIPAGVQIKKTLQGLDDVSKGYAESKAGRVKYPVEQSTSNAIRGGLFGASNLPEAQEYYKEDNQPLGEKQSELFKIAGDQKKIYGDFMQTREKNAEVDKIKESLAAGAPPQGETQESTFNIDGLPVNGYTSGNKFIYLDELTGDVKTASIPALQQKELAQDKELNTAQFNYNADLLKRAEDYKGYETNLDGYIKYLEEYKTKISDKADQLKTQTLINDKKAELEKIRGYGGFTKPRKLKVSMRSVPKIKLNKPKKIKTKKVKLAQIRLDPQGSTNAKKVELKF